MTPAQAPSSQAEGFPPGDASRAHPLPLTRPSPGVALGLTAALLAHHFGLWAWTAHRRGFPLLEALNQWDSALYGNIITQGYTDPLWAFLPLYPGTVWGLRALLGGGLPPQVVGCVLSSACLLAFVAWASRPEVDAPLTPRTTWGWFFFLYSPASFALHSHHTEGLFLLLSFGALASAWRGRVLLAAGFAALCIWTRNQGMFVALASGLLLLERPGTWGARLWRFATVGAVSLAAVAGLLAFEFYASGDPLAHVHAQRHWNHADSVWSAVRGLWFGNAWHKPGWWLGLRNVFAAVLLAASVALLRGRERGSRPLGVYGLLSLAVMLPQGDLGNAFRFGAVLFPALFLVGDWFAGRPAWLRWSMALLTFWLNHKVTHSFSIHSWAY